MRVVYVAGPFRAGANQWKQEQNVRRAEALALDVWKLGAVAICPHSMTRFYQGALPDDVWLDGDLELLHRCDAILMMPDWEQSMGARAEHRAATEWKQHVFYNIDDVYDWLERYGK